MGKIRALLVGIDDYPATVAGPLSGCRNDIAEAHRLLTDLLGARADILVLRDAEATVAAVEEAVVRHLGAAGDGDRALLWFSGHGTELLATGADLLVEATGRNQALVCVDGPLLDKRLGALLEQVAAGGARVTAVLDCCHSGGATRKDAEVTKRFTPPMPGWTADASTHDASEAYVSARDAPEAYIPARDASGGTVVRHLLLAASRLDQPSYEGWFDGRRHGAFTHALIGAVRAAGPGATGRELLAAAAARVRRGGRDQQPVLYPDLPGGAADRPFLDDTRGSAPSPHLLLRFGADGWEVDCGSGHGLREGAGAQGTEFAVIADARSAGLVVRARDVRVNRTVVDPVGWAPDRARVYPVALSALALPPASVGVEGSDDVVRQLTEVVSTSPLLRVADGPAGAAGLHLRVRVADGAAQVLRRDGTAFVEPMPYGEGGGGDARRVVECLAHLTRWHRLRDLTPRPTLLDGLVRLEVAPWGAGPGEVLHPDATGEFVCPYTPGPDGPQPPRLSIRIHNHSPDRKLWCLLVDLTDRYASHATLYPGHFIGPGRTGHALDGDPVQLSLPQGRPVVPGAESRDWLRLIVAEGELNTVPFRLPAWDPEVWVGRDPLDHVLRLDPTPPAYDSRDLGPVAGGGPGRWTALTVPLRTVVPG
jgi:hypothetical protein